MNEQIKLKMNVSLAGTVDGKEFSGQPGDVVLVGSATARKWLTSKLAVRAAASEPLSSANDLLADLTAEECLRRRCSSCDVRRARFVLRNRPYCESCYLAELS